MHDGLIMPKLERFALDAERLMMRALRQAIAEERKL